MTIPELKRTVASIKGTFWEHVCFHKIHFLSVSRLTKFQIRLWKSVNTLEYFTSNEWYFSNDNMVGLHKSLEGRDQDTFNFDMKSIDWTTYMENYCIGTKKYALKEDMSRIGQAKATLRK